jgi:TonB family protein
MMRLVFLLLVLTNSTLGQTLPRVRSEEAAKHLVSSTPPIYPALARQGRISGDVLLEIAVAPDGKTRVRHVISGHPLLVDSAVIAVSGWRFRPFFIDGKPATVVTVLIVPFDNNEAQHPASLAQAAFQYDFWTTERLAQAALAGGNLQAAETQLKKAQELLAPVAGEWRDILSRSQWFLDSGNLSKAQQKYDEAERNYHAGLELLQKGDKGTPEVAAALAGLGALYLEEKRYDLALDDLSRAIAIYQKNFKKTGSGDPDARQFYGEVIANDSWMLSEVERSLKNYPEAINRCRTVLEFQEFLSAASRDSIVSGCQKTIAEPIR